MRLHPLMRFRGYIATCRLNAAGSSLPVNSAGPKSPATPRQLEEDLSRKLALLKPGSEQWNAARFEGERKIGQQLDAIDMRNVPVGFGLNYFGLLIRQQYRQERATFPRGAVSAGARRGRRLFRRNRSAAGAPRHIKRGLWRGSGRRRHSCTTGLCRIYTRFCCRRRNGTRSFSWARKTSMPRTWDMS